MSPIHAIPVTFVAILLAGPAPSQRETPPPARPVVGEAVATIVEVEPRLDAAGLLHLDLTASPRRANGPFVLEAGEHALSDLIDRAATWLGRNYLTTPTDFQGPPPTRTVRLQTELQLDADGLERTLGHLLYSRGFAVVATSEELGIYEVVQMNGPRRGEISLRARQVTADEALRNADRMEQILTVVELRNIDARTAATATRPFFSQSGSSIGALMVGNLGNETSMLIQGFAPQVAAAVRMIRMADESAGVAAERARVENLEQRLRQLESRQPQFSGATTTTAR